MTANTTLYEAGYIGLSDTALLGETLSPHHATSSGRAALLEFLKALALFQTITVALDPYSPIRLTQSFPISQSLGATPVHTATTITDTSPAPRQQTEELLEVSLPRLPLSVQRASVSFALRTHTVPRLVGGSDLVAN